MIATTYTAFAEFKSDFDADDIESIKSKYINFAQTGRFIASGWFKEFPELEDIVMHSVEATPMETLRRYAFMRPYTAMIA
jgi:hypothetical protein